MAAENRRESKPGYEISPDDVPSLNLTEAEEKMLYLRYVIRREHEPFKLIHYQYLIELLEARICLLQQTH
jgi:hypothetical protein